MNNRNANISYQTSTFYSQSVPSTQSAFQQKFGSSFTSIRSKKGTLWYTAQSFLLGVFVTVFQLGGLRIFEDCLLTVKNFFNTHFFNTLCDIVLHISNGTQLKVLEHTLWNLYVFH